MACIPCIVALRRHPETDSKAVENIEARVAWREDGALALIYHLKGDLKRLRIPSPRPPCRGNRLWEHTCFEAFVSVKGTPAYREFNFAPSREWASYAFRRYREEAPAEDDELVPAIIADSTCNGFQLDAAIRVDRFLARDPRVPLRVGLSAVVEDKHGRLGYWALRHPPGKPDFHNAEAFALELGWPDPDAGHQPTVGKR